MTHPIQPMHEPEFGPENNPEMVQAATEAIAADPRIKVSALIQRFENIEKLTSAVHQRVMVHNAAERAREAVAKRKGKQKALESLLDVATAKPKRRPSVAEAAHHHRHGEKHGHGGQDNYGEGPSERPARRGENQDILMAALKEKKVAEEAARIHKQEAEAAAKRAEEAARIQKQKDDALAKRAEEAAKIQKQKDEAAAKHKADLETANTKIDEEIIFLKSVQSKISDMRKQLADYKELFESIQDFTFIKTSTKCQAYRASAKHKFNSLEGHLSKAAEKARDDIKALKDIRLSPSLEPKHQALQHARKMSEQILKTIAVSSRNMVTAAGRVEVGIEEQALRNYVLANPSKAMQEFEKIDRMVSIATTVATAFTPPTHAWVSALSKLMIDAGFRGGKEYYVHKAVEENVANETHSERMEHLDDNPAAIAKGTAQNWMDNLHLVRDALVAIGGFAPFANLAIEAVFLTVQNIVEAKVREAVALAEQAKNSPAETVQQLNDQFPPLHDSLKDGVAAVRASFFPQLQANAKARLKEGGDAANFGAQAISGNFNLEATATSTVTFVFDQIVKVVLTAYKPDRAQLVTGTVLKNKLQKFTEISHLLPAGLTIDASQAPSSPEQRRSAGDPLPFETFMDGKVVDYHEKGAERTSRGSDSKPANPNQVYIAVKFKGKKVWLYADKTNRSLIGYDRPSGKSLHGAWGTREIVHDGYKEGGVHVSGTWHKPFAHYYVLDTGSAYEFVHGSTAIHDAGSRSTVEATLSPLEAKMKPIDWTPDK